MALALGATPIRVWATSPTLYVLVPATNIGVESLGNLWFIATVSVEDLSVELALAVSGNLQLLDPTRGSDQVALVGAVAIPFAAAGCSLPRLPR